MTRHTRSILFTIGTSICNILITIFTVVLITGSFILLFYRLGLVKQGGDNQVFMILLPFVFFASLILSLKLYMKFARLVIRVLKLDGKLDDKILKHYSVDNDKTL